MMKPKESGSSPTGWKKDSLKNKEDTYNTSVFSAKLGTGPSGHAVYTVSGLSEWSNYATLLMWTVEYSKLCSVH